MIAEHRVDLYCTSTHLYLVLSDRHAPSYISTRPVYGSAGTYTPLNIISSEICSAYCTVGISSHCMCPFDC